MTYLRQLRAVLWKDLVVELRTRERTISMAGFTVLVAFLFNHALDPARVDVQDVAAGLLWMTVVFAGTLGVGRTFQLESEDGAFHGVLMSPTPKDAIYLGKVAANFVILLLIALLALAVFGLFFHLQYGTRPFVLLLVMALGILGFVALATLFSAITQGTVMGDTLLPILLFPLLVPMVIYGVSATDRLLAGRPVTEIAGHLRMLAAFALVAVFSGAGLFRFVVEE
jgi:heme exporter protein B